MKSQRWLSVPTFKPSEGFIEIFKIKYIIQHKITLDIIKSLCSVFTARVGDRTKSNS